MRYVRIFNECVLTFLFSFIFRKSERLPPITDAVLLKPATQLAEQIRSGKLKSVNLLKAYIARIQAVQPTVNAVVEERFSDALQEAAEADQLVASRAKSPEELAREKPFLGVPLTTKNCYAVKGMIQDSGLVARAGVRAPQDADCMALMRRAGAIPMAVTNVPELAMYWESYNNLHGRTNNPYDSRRICGGSSGGEGSLIGSAGSVIGIGTDIGGSIRMPAFFNGIFGHKPTTGLVSNKGQYPPARDDSLDFCLVAGPMCRYADDLSPMLRIMAADNLSLVQLDEPVDFSKLKVFYMLDDGGSHLVTPVDREMKASVTKVVKHFTDTYGCPTTDANLGRYFRCSMQIFNARLAGANVPSFASELSLLKGEVDVVHELFRWIFGQSPHTLPALGLCLLERVSPKKGNPAVQHFLDKAATLSTKLRELLGDDGIFIYPSHPEPAPFHYQTMFKPFNYAYTAIFNVLGLPVTQCPMGLGSAGTPLGVQVVGNMHKDHLCLAAAKEIERVFGGWVSPSLVQVTDK